MILTPLLPFIVTFIAPIGLVTIQQTRTITAQPTESRVYKNDLKAHFFFPKGWKASDKRPAIVLFHGGGWTGGVRNAAREINIGTTLASHGCRTAVATGWCRGWKVTLRHMTPRLPGGGSPSRQRA